MIALRPVEVPWTCDRSGDCCTIPSRVVMTLRERDLLMANSTAIMQWADVLGREDLVALVAKPCPLYGTAPDGRPGCTVHAVRPYNCRRFACLRPESSEEPFVEAGPEDLGCANLGDRIRHSREARRFYQRYQRKAQRWAVQMGWRNQ